MNNEEFVKIVNECGSMAYAAKKVGMAYTSFVRKAKKLGCYKPNQGGKGICRSSSGRTKFLLEDVLDGKVPNYQTYKLKVRMIKAGIIKDECCLCGWNKKPEGAKYSPCELDHINGDPTDHRLINLWLICPNCHSLTETYRFRRGKTNGVEHQSEKLPE